jgi:hypothetical protein
MDLAASNAALARVASNSVKYRHVLVRSSAMQAYTLKRRDTGGFSVPGLGSLPSMPLPAGLRRATDSMLAQSGVLAKQLAERSRDALANATASLNSSSLQAGLQAAAASVQRGMANAANQSELAVRGMLAKSKTVMQPNGGKAAGAKGGRASGRQSGGSIGTLPSTVRYALRAPRDGPGDSLSCVPSRARGRSRCGALEPQRDSQPVLPRARARSVLPSVALARPLTLAPHSRALRSRHRPPDAAMASALRQKRAALAAARMSLSADDDDDETDADDDADEDESADDVDEDEEADDDDADEGAAADADDDADDDAESDDDDDDSAPTTDIASVAGSKSATASAPADAAGTPSAAPPSDGDFAAAAGGGEDAWGDDGATDDWGSEPGSDDEDKTPP